jgi:hypothetical protein
MQCDFEREQLQCAGAVAAAANPTRCGATTKLRRDRANLCAREVTDHREHVVERLAHASRLRPTWHARRSGTTECCAERKGAILWHNSFESIGNRMRLHLKFG